MSPLQGGKLWFLEHVGLSKDALHIYVALVIFLGGAILMRWRLSSWKPWLVVAAAALAGEAWDLRDSRIYRIPIRPWANLHDVINTLLWPTVLLLLARGHLLRP